jgi:hypothetical protein
MHGGATPQLQRLAAWVLSQVVNTSSVERCWSTYSFIHSIKRNRLNVGWAESLVYGHYNLRLLSHYREEAKMDKNLKRWDNTLGEDNLKDGVLLLEQLENALLNDDDRVELRPPSTAVFPVSKNLATTLGASSSLPLRQSTSTFAQFRPSQEAPLPPQGGPRNNCGGGRRLG